MIQKKDPLILPPDYSKLPNPDGNIEISEQEENQIEIVLKKNSSINEEDQNSKKSNSSLEKVILKKIQKQ